MPIQIRAPDGSIAQFPDGMADADIEKVMQQHYPVQAPLSDYERYRRNPAAYQAEMAAPHPTAPREAESVQFALQGLKGIPVAGALIPQTPEMTQYEQQHPGATLGARLLSGAGTLGAAAAAAPVAFGAEAPAAMSQWPSVAQYLGRLGIGSATAGGIGGADQAARMAAAPMTGQQPPEASATMKALGVPSTGYSVPDAALTSAGLNAALVPAASGIGAALAPAIKRSAQTLTNLGVRLSPGQQIGGPIQTAEKLGGAIPFSGMENIHDPALPSFNRAAENMALKPADIPELAPFIHSKVPNTWEEAAMKGPPAAPAAAPEAPASQEFVRPGNFAPREPATHTMQIGLGNGTHMLMEGTPAELEAASGQIQQVAGPGAQAYNISPKSHWIGASMPVRRAPPISPAGTPAGSSGVPGPAGGVGIGPAAELPPGSQYRGNVSGGGPLGAPVPGAGVPGYLGTGSTQQGAQFRGNLQGEPADFVAARAGKLPEDAVEPAAEQTAGRTGPIDPGFQGRQFVRQQIQKTYDIALHGAPGEPTPYLLADLPKLRGRLQNPDMPGVKPETLQTYQDVMNRYVFNRFQGVQSGAPDSALAHATIGGPSLSNGMREIDKIASAARRRGGDGYDLSTALMNAKGDLMGSLKAQEPVTDARLKAADEMWSHYAELRSAGAKAKDELQGQFTPGQLSSGSATADKSQFKRATSEGTTRYGDFARAGIDVGISPPEKVPTMAKLEGLGIVGAAGYANPWAAAAVPLAGNMYASALGQGAANAYLQNVAPMIRGAAPAFGRAMAMPPTAEAVRQALGANQ